MEKEKLDPEKNVSISSREYHVRTKHSLQKYAAAPETLDWSLQPNPFRFFKGCKQIPLSLNADELTTPYKQLFQNDSKTIQTLSINSIATLFELSLGLSAWKQYGPDKWALRCNPSSGNLHPTESYLVNWDNSLTEAGIYHYRSDEHSLEQRCIIDSSTSHSMTELHNQKGFIIGLSSIYWREAWKYGERAYRYCQLDTGHAIASISFAAACLGWNAMHLDTISDEEQCRLLGLSRQEDFENAEQEHPDLLLYISTEKSVDKAAITSVIKELCEYVDQAKWTGIANRLDHHPMYSWDVIDQVSASTTKPETIKLEQNNYIDADCISFIHEQNNQASKLIRQRRSAQAFDNSQYIEKETFFQIIDKLLLHDTPPWNSNDLPPRIHPVFYVHRVTGLKPGLYALPRHEEAKTLLKNNMRAEFNWNPVADCPQHIPLYELVTANCQNAARTLSCQQPIASDSAFCVSMLAEFTSALEEGEWNYRYLHWEAGLLGHVMYLEAENLNQRGTGIGCFFDDSVHQVLGIETESLQVIYHFTLGTPIVDQRLISLPPYGHLTR